MPLEKRSGRYAHSSRDDDPRWDDRYRDDEPSRDAPYRHEPYGTGSRRRDGRDGAARSRRTPVLLSAVVALVVLAAIGVAVQVHASSGARPAALPLKQQTAVASQAATSARPTAAHAAKTASAKPTPDAPQQLAGATGAEPPSGWKLAFFDDFEGSALNTSVWATCYWWAAPGSGCTNNGNNNEEKEWYQPSQVTVRDGALNLTAQRAATQGTDASGAPQTYQCRSGMVTTAPSFNFEYGMVQVVTRVPFGSGLWEGFWLAASSHAWPPEVDLMEHWNSDAAGKFYLHPTSGERQGGAIPVPGVDLSAGWHTLTLSWTKSELTWYLDGHQVLSTTTGVPQQSMYFIANLADTSTAAGACDGTVQIKSVKIWQPG